MNNETKSSAAVGGPFALANTIAGLERLDAVDEHGHATKEARAAIVSREVVAPPAYPFGLGFNAK